MLFIIPVIWGLSAGLGAWAIMSAKRDEAKEAATETDRGTWKSRQEMKEREVWRTIVSERFIEQYELRIKPERLIKLAEDGDSAVEGHIRRTNSPCAVALRQARAEVRTHQGNKKELDALKDSILSARSDQ